MKKKVLLFLVILATLTCAFVLVANAETPEMYVEFKARFEGSDDYVTVYTENAGDSNAPVIDFTNKAFYSDIDFTTEVNMANATGIDFSEAYSNNTENNVSEVKKPSAALTKCVEVKWFTEGVTTIPHNMFDDCTSLKSFDFGCAEVIGRYAFRKTVLTDLVVPSNVSEIDNYAFSDCASLVSIDFEYDVILGTHVFRNCSSLATLGLDNLSIIGKSMFYNCDALTSVTISKNITNIGDAAFDGCGGLVSVTFEEGFQGVIGEGAFKNTTALVNVNLCEGIESLPKQCFYKSAISKITLPDSVKTLGDQVFSSSSLSEIVMSENSQLSSIDGNAFSACKSLKSIYLPTGIKIATTNLFQNCTALEVVYNFENVIFASEKGENVFVGDTFSSCSSLKEIIIPLTTKKIDGKCTQLTSLGKIYIPAGVEAISNTFANSITTSCTIFYCGGNAKQLLSLTNTNGITSSSLKTRIDNEKTIKFTGADVTYPKGYIVYEANSCELFYNGEHVRSLEYDFSFIDEFGNATDKKFVSDFKVSYLCTRNCGKEVTVEILPAMFTFNGYSTPDDGRNSLTIGYGVNNESIRKYEEYTNTTLNVGVFAVEKNQLADNDVFNENGEASNGVAKTEIKKDIFYSFDFKISGFVTDELKNALLAIGVYVFENNGAETYLTYIQSGKPLPYEKYSFISYNEIVNA